MQIRTRQSKLRFKTKFSLNSRTVHDEIRVENRDHAENRRRRRLARVSHRTSYAFMAPSRTTQNGSREWVDFNVLLTYFANESFRNQIKDQIKNTFVKRRMSQANQRRNWYDKPALLNRQRFSGDANFKTVYHRLDTCKDRPSAAVELRRRVSFGRPHTQWVTHTHQFGYDQ